jgi:histidine triad (HIT) family protein
MNPQQLTPEQQKELEEKLKNMSPEELLEFQKQQCIFCQIISGKIPAKKVYEDNKVIAILDINPAAKGHILLLPKEHYAIMPQIPEKEIEGMFVVAKKMSQVLLKGLKVSGTNVFVANGLAAGQKAQHFMIHVIPRKEGDNVLEIEEKLTDEEMRKKVKSLIGNKFNDLMGVKKEVVEKEEKIVKKKTKKKKEESKKEETEEVAKKEEKVEDVEEDIEETDDGNDDDENQEEEKEEESDEEPEEQIENEDQEEDVEETDDSNEKEEKGGANLDDIANLFT